MSDDGLRVEGLRAGYGSLEVLHGTTMAVPAGSLTLLTGPNGAGKTTLLNAVLGTVDVGGGDVRFDGHDLVTLDRDARRALGIANVPEDRGLFAGMTVWENLRVAGHVWGLAPAATEAAIERLARRFPLLRERLHARVSTLSGGQQQLIAIARALLADPRLLLLDEPSKGLSVAVWSELLGLCRELTAEGCAVFMVEQRVLDVVDLVDHFAIMRRGEIVRTGDGGAEMLDDGALRDDYLALDVDVEP